MKKRILLAALSLFAIAAQGQVTLTGTSYTQNFDGLNTGLPVGWTAYTAATATSLGTQKTLTGSGVPALPSQIGIDTSCAGLVLGGGFKNYPSAAVISPSVNFCPGTSGTSTVSGTYTDRALGVRQTGATSPTTSSFADSDPGAAFVLELANTSHISGITLTFDLQSLDTSSPRQVTWKVDYGTGTTPTSFTPISTTGTMTTGGHVFSNNHISATLPTAMSNLSSPVWIRVVTLTPSVNSYNRPTTAIDNFKLTYTNTGTGVDDIATEAALALNVIGAASSDKISFAYSTEEAGNYNLVIYDLAGRVLHNETISTKAGYSEVAVSGLSLASGMYIAKMSNGTGSAAAKIVIQ